MSLFDLVLMFHLSILCDHSSLLFLFSLFLGFALHNIHEFHIRLFLSLFSKIKKIKKKKRKRKEKCVLHNFSWIWNHGWPYYLYITCLCTLFSLDELILLHFTSLSFVVHVVWELFIVFDYIILILKSHAFDCKDQKILRKRYK